MTGGWARDLVFYGRTGKFTFRMLAAVLVGQSVIVFFGALVARGLQVAEGGGAAAAYLVVGSALAVLCLVTAGLMRSPIGVTLGWLIQLTTFASAAVVPMMAIVGLIFGGLWVACMVQGVRIDRQQAAGSARPTGSAGGAAH
ncbi:MAG TPA: DUF4233 domain-containing protein [Dermatophilaceae bacterium]|nr:DUF4233 domain-containing protein [Dermatophilaceae bacterium]